MSSWSFARAEHEKHFQVVADLGYELRRLSHAEYYALHEEHLRQFFPPEVFVNLRALNTAHEQEGQARIEETMAAKPLEDGCVGFKDGKPVIFFAGTSKTTNIYGMRLTNIHPDHRRKGIYRAILQGTIGYTKALGFDAIVSDHAPGNNAILIAKLKAGFRIVSMEVDPMVGLSVVLKYFHNPDHLAAYEWRCGLATVNERILRAGGGAMPLLREQLGAVAPLAETDDSPV